MIRTEIVKDADKFLQFVFSGQYEVHHLTFLSNKAALVQWKYKEGCVIPPGPSTKVFIAAFTTALARLKLYGCLEQVQRDALYADTDSPIHVSRAGEPRLPLGNYLGNLTDELGGDTTRCGCPVEIILLCPGGCLHQHIDGSHQQSFLAQCCQRTAMGLLFHWMDQGYG